MKIQEIELSKPGRHPLPLKWDQPFLLYDKEQKAFCKDFMISSQTGLVMGGEEQTILLPRVGYGKGWKPFYLGSTIELTIHREAPFQDTTATCIVCKTGFYFALVDLDQTLVFSLIKPDQMDLYSKPHNELIEVKGHYFDTGGARGVHWDKWKNFFFDYKLPSK